MPAAEPEGAAASRDDECFTDITNFASPASSHKNLNLFCRERNQALLVDLPCSTLVTPRSCYYGYGLPQQQVEPVDERRAMSAFMSRSTDQSLADSTGFLEIDLDNFCVYINSANYPQEMRSLHNLATKLAHDTFYFDGTLSLGGRQFLVSRAPFNRLPIGNYGRSNPTIGGEIWIQSALNAGKDVYYRLKNPAFEYARFYQPFLWVADLAKHAVDFSEFRISQQQHVGLEDFKDLFNQWLWEEYGKLPSFHKWYCQHKGPDFRTSIVANVDFIHKEMFSVLGSAKTRSLALFHQTRDFCQYNPFGGPTLEGEIRPTIVNSYVMACFGHTQFGHILKLAGLDTETTKERRLVDKPAEMKPMASVKHCASLHPPIVTRLERKVVDLISVGDVISTHRDSESTGTKWKKETAVGAVDDDRWFGLVQKVYESKQGHRSFDVIWLYRPGDTPCGRMKYPWPNELFLSDHCTCEEGRDAKVDEDEILGVTPVHWHGTPRSCFGQFFIRQTYLVAQRRWIGLEESHLRCSHGRPPKPNLRVGDTILTLSGNNTDALAEPYQVTKIFKQHGVAFVRLKLLLRGSRFDPEARPNELLYPEEGKHEVVRKIEDLLLLRACLVRCFLPNEPILPPYSRDGTSNVFFITRRIVADRGTDRSMLVPFEDKAQFPRTLRQGFNPAQNLNSKPKLKGLDLFCGSGNFGRGLEEGGAIEMRWVNDIWDRAIHTYMANAPDPAATRPFLGSIDDLLRSALEGNFADNVPRPGEVDFICAGSPCQGFSLLTTDRTTPQQRKNQSLVAAFATAVDLYRPKYGILENVVTIIQAGDKRVEDVFSQLICAVVGMGYQTQLAIGDAWSYGCPQSRSRIFLYFAAPGMRLPTGPVPSHSHPPNIKQRDLGKISNGEHFVQRLFRPAAFHFISAEESTKDLPRIYDGKPDNCIMFPDHRVSFGVTAMTRQQISLIPTHPYAMNFVSSWKDGHGVMTSAERTAFPPKGKTRVSKTSKGWGRIHPRYLFQTISTSCAPTDARMGRQLHWCEDRPVTLMEARRAQGFLDEEVLLGSLQDKWKLVGNSVSRPVALAFGLQFREAWVGSLHDEAPVILDQEHTEQRESVCRPSTASSVSPGDWGTPRVASATPASSITQIANLGPREMKTDSGARKRLASVNISPGLIPPQKISRRSRPQISVDSSQVESSITTPRKASQRHRTRVGPTPTVVRLSAPWEEEYSGSSG